MLKRKEISLLNSDIKSCFNCNLSKTRKNPICGEGNLDTKIMLIAQAPGIQEDIEGKMFIGPSGQILNELLKGANINRKDIYMTNLIKCMLPKYRKPKRNEIKSCSQYLDREIEIINPQILIPLGFRAIKYVFTKYNQAIPSKDQYHSIFGKLYLTPKKKILPLPHPATLLHHPPYKEEVKNHYYKLNIILEECKWYRVCPIKFLYEQRKIPKFWVELYCKGDWFSCVRFHMEEEGKSHSDRMLPDGTYLE